MPFQDYCTRATRTTRRAGRFAPVLLVILATNVIRSTTSVKAATSSTAIMLDNNWLGPAGLAVSEDAKTLLIACGKSQQVEVFDLVLGKSVRAYPQGFERNRATTSKRVHNKGARSGCPT